MHCPLGRARQVVAVDAVSRRWKGCEDEQVPEDELTAKDCSGAGGREGGVSVPDRDCHWELFLGMRLRLRRGARVRR